MACSNVSKQNISTANIEVEILTAQSEITGTPEASRTTDTVPTKVAIVRETRLARTESYATVIALTPSPLATQTNTPIPTLTPTIILPSPTTVTPSITPTLDTSKIEKATPAQPEQCPETSENVNVPDFEALFNNDQITEEHYLEYFNAGGSLYNIPLAWRLSYTLDLTNDGVPEYIIQRLRPRVGFSILGCKQGQYESLFYLPISAYLGESPEVISIGDFNRNGIQEIVLLVDAATQAVTSYQVAEWDGESFRALAVSHWNPEEVRSITGFAPLEQFHVRDVDQNGIMELIWDWDIPVWSIYLDGLPWRKERQIYAWNGSHYVRAKVELSPPEYRFQAVQDGDRTSLAGEYDQALGFYQQAIFDNELDWWTEERWWYEVSQGTQVQIKPTPIASIQPDPNEYFYLSAYARYRIMLLHAQRGWVDDAQIVLETLKEKFPQGQPGSIFAEIAGLFWESYSLGNDMKTTCDVVIQYVEQNQKEVFSYLGNSYENEIYHFGDQSIDYEPVDICPFQ